MCSQSCGKISGMYDKLSLACAFNSKMHVRNKEVLEKVVKIIFVHSV